MGNCQNMRVQWSFCQGKLPHQISVSSSLELLRSQVVSQKSIPRSRMHRTSRKFSAANHELTSDYWNVRTVRNFIARKRCFVTVFPMFLKVWVPVPGNTIFSTFQHPKYVKFSDPPIGGSIKYAQFLIFDFAGRQSVRIRNYGSGMSAPLPLHCLRAGKPTFGRETIRIHLINEDFDLNVVSDRCRMVLRSCLRLVAVNAVGEKYEEGTTLADELVKLIRWRFRKTSALGETFLIQHLAHRKRTLRTKWYIHQNDTSVLFHGKIPPYKKYPPW